MLPDKSIETAAPSSSPSTLGCAEIPEADAYDTKSRPRPARSHADVDRVFAVLNRELFHDFLPPCLITSQRTRGAYGYFSGDRLVNIDNHREVVDEIALNPIHTARQGTTNVLATLAHEMVHLWQHHFGKPSRGGYHNKEWARKMSEIGLVPSSTGAPGGKPIGESVSHYIRPGGRFEEVCTACLATDTTVLFQDRAYRDLPEGESAVGGSDGTTAGGESRLEKAERERQRKTASKTRYSCLRTGLNAWAKPGVRLLCGCCENEMSAR
jgi:hypothetical protein